MFEKMRYIWSKNVEQKPAHTQTYYFKILRRVDQRVVNSWHLSFAPF